MEVERSATSGQAEPDSRRESFQGNTRVPQEQHELLRAGSIPRDGGRNKQDRDLRVGGFSLGLSDFIESGGIWDVDGEQTIKMGKSRLASHSRKMAS